MVTNSKAKTIFLVAMAFVAVTTLTGCDDEPTRAVGNSAPRPGGYPNVPPNSPVFNPQMPVQQPTQFYPFMPIEGFMSQNPQLYYYWQSMWQQWQYTAYYWGTSEYDFQTFWYDYCPQVWQGTQYNQIYQYLDSYFYWWNSPQQQLPQQANAYDFWYQYQNYPYYQWGCQSGCW